MKVRTQLIIFIIIIVVTLGISTWESVPAWNECRAAGHSKNTCLWTIKYWRLKSYWGFK